MSKIDALLSRLHKVRQTGSGKWLSCCPAHDDKTPSLGVKLTDDDKILIHCWAGCSVSEIVASVGMTLSDLMPEKPQGYDRRPTPIPRFNRYELFDLILFESLILSMAVRQFLNGNAITDDDLKRIKQAEAIISELAREAA